MNQDEFVAEDFIFSRKDLITNLYFLNEARNHLFHNFVIDTNQLGEGAFKNTKLDPFKYLENSGNRQITKEEIEKVMTFCRKAMVI